jgi:hypothetical protein
MEGRPSGRAIKEIIDVHQSEGIIIHFTDNSSMAISIGSNTYNLYLEKISNQQIFILT